MTIKFKYKPVRKLLAKANSIEAFANIDRVLFSNLQEMHLKDFSILAKLKQIKAAVLGCFHNDIELLLDILNTPNDNLPYLGVLTFEPLHLLTGLHVLHQKSCTDSILKLINFDCLDYQYQAYGVTPAVEILKMGDGLRDAMRDRILRDIVKAIESTNFTKALRLIDFDKEYFKTAIVPNGMGQTLLFIAAKHLSLNTDNTAKIAFLKELIQNYGFDVNAIDANGQNCAAFVTGLINNLQTLDAPIPDLGILDGISTAINFASYSTTMHKHTYINIKNNELTREILLLSMQQRYKLTTAEQEVLKQRQLFNLRPSVLNLFISKAQIFDLDISCNLAKFIVEHIYPCVAAIDLQRCTFTDNAAELLIEGLRDDPVIEYVDFETTNLSMHEQLLLSEVIKTLPTPVLAQNKLEEIAKAAALAPKTAIPPEKPRSAELQAISEIKDIEERVKQHLAYEMRENEKRILENIKIIKQSKINLAIDVLAGNFASSSVDALNGTDNCFEVLTTILSSQIYVHSSVGDLAPIKKYGSKTLSKIIYLVEENNVYYGYSPNLKIIVPNIPDELNLFRACMHASLSILPTPHITNWGMDDICPIQLRNIALTCGANVQAVLGEKTHGDYIDDFANCNLERLQGIINNLVVEHYTLDIDKSNNIPEPINDDIALIRHKANILKAQDYHAVFAAYEKESKEIHKYRTTASLERTKALYDISENEKNYASAPKMIREAIAACTNGDLATIKQLKYEYDDKVWQTFCASLPLAHALKHKQTHIVAYLLDNNVDYLNIVHKNTKEFNLAARLATVRSFDSTLLDILAARLSQDLLDEQHDEQGVLPFPEYTDLTDKQKDNIVFFCKILISASESIEQKSLDGLIENNLTVLNEWALDSIKAEKSAVQAAHLQQMQLIAKHDARLSLQYVRTLADVDEHFVKLVNDNIEAYNIALKKFLAEQQKALDDYKRAENEAKRTAARRKYQKFFKIIAGIGAGVFLTPFVAPAFSGLGAFATAVLEGATFSFISTGIAGGNPLKSAITGGAFAGLGHLVGKALDVTKLNDIMKDAIQSASSASLHSAIYGGKLFDNVAFSVGGSAFGNYAVPKGVLGDANKLTRQALRKRIIENTVRAAVTAVPVTMLHGGNLADSLAAGAMGAASAAVGGFGAELGAKAASAANDAKSPPVAKDSVKPTATKTKPSVLPKQTKASPKHTMPNTAPRANYSYASATHTTDKTELKPERRKSRYHSYFKDEPDLDFFDMAKYSASMFSGALDFIVPPAYASEFTNDIRKPITSHNLESGVGKSLLISSGRLFVESGQGIKQLGLMAGEKFGWVPHDVVARYTQQIRSEDILYNSTPVANSISGKVGHFGAGVLLYSVIPGGSALRGYRLAAAGAASGGLVMATQPVYDGSWGTKGVNVGLGSVTGGLMAPLAAKSFDVAGKSIVRLFDARRASSAYTQQKLPNQAVRLTKGQIVDYLQNVDKVPLEQLINDMGRMGKSGLKLHNPELIQKVGIYKFKYTNAKTGVDKIFVEIHKAKGPNDYHHMHITDRFGNVYDKHLNNLTTKFRKENPDWHSQKLKRVVDSLPEAHINLKEFVELKMRHNID